MLSPEKRRLSGDFMDVYKHPTGESRGARARIFLAVPTDRKFYLAIKRSFFTVRLPKYRNRLPRKGME